MNWCKGQSSSGEDVEECVYCQRPWTEVESLPHGVFDCESLEQVPQLSYSKFGPSSYASIDCNTKNWFEIINQMSSTPYSEKVNGKGISSVLLAWRRFSVSTKGGVTPLRTMITPSVALIGC